MNVAYFDNQCLEALQEIGTELHKIREIMEEEKSKENPSLSIWRAMNGYQRTGKESR